MHNYHSGYSGYLGQIQKERKERFEMNYAGKNVLITGGAGMIGSHMAKKMCEFGAKVTVVDNLISGSELNIKGLDVDFKCWDLRNHELCDLATRKQDIVFGFAADMGGISYITNVHADIMHNNVLMNANMLEAAKKNNVKQYFYSSSACAYPGYKQLDPYVPALKESDAYPGDPDQSYGWEKLFTEQMCLAYQKDYGMDIRIARFHNIYAESYTSFDKDRAKAPCKMILKAVQGRPIEIWHDGKQTRSFCYIDDCIKAILLLMDSDYDEPINIGSSISIDMITMANLVKEISGKNLKIKFYPNKPQGVRGRNSDNSLIKMVLGYEPDTPLSIGFSKVYKWAVEHYDELENIE